QIIIDQYKVDKDKEVKIATKIDKDTGKKDIPDINTQKNGEQDKSTLIIKELPPNLINNDRKSNVNLKIKDDIGEYNVDLDIKGKIKLKKNEDYQPANPTGVVTNSSDKKAVIVLPKNQDYNLKKKSQIINNHKSGDDGKIYLKKSKVK